MNKSDALQVVVIEDNEILLRLYENNFKKANFAIDFQGFKFAKDAIDHLMVDYADLIIVDIQLPDIDGYDLIDSLYAFFAMYGTKVIVISSDSEEYIRSNGRMPEDISVFSKPVPFNYLLDKLEVMHTFKVGLSSRF